MLKKFLTILCVVTMTSSFLPTMTFAAKQEGNMLFYETFDTYPDRKTGTLVYGRDYSWTTDTMNHHGAQSRDFRTYITIMEEPGYDIEGKVIDRFSKVPLASTVGRWDTSPEENARLAPATAEPEEGEKKNRVLRIGSLPEGINNAGQIQKQVVLKSDAVITFRFMTNSPYGENLVWLSNSGNTVNLLTVKEMKAYSGTDKTPILEMEPGRWYTANVLINTGSKTYNLYIDGKKASTYSYSINSGVNFNNPTNFVIQSKGALKKENPNLTRELEEETIMYYDDIAIYLDYKAKREEEWKDVPQTIMYDAARETNYLQAQMYQEKVEELADKALMFSVGGSKAYANGEMVECPAPIFLQGLPYLPAVFTAKQMGYSAEKIENGYKIGSAVATATSITMGGKTHEYAQAAEVGDEVFVPAEYLAQLFNKTLVHINLEQFVALADNDRVFDLETDTKYMQEVVRRLTYSRPTPEQIKADYEKNKERNSQHPRLHKDEAGFEELRQIIKTDPEVGRWFDILKAQSDAKLADPLQEFSMTDGMRLALRSDQIIYKIPDMAFVYQITKDEKYAKRCVEEILNCLDWPTWQPSIFLGISAFTESVCLVYDWCYDFFTPEQRELIKETIFSRTLQEEIEVYQYNPDGPWNNKYDYATRGSNWASVCASGIFFAATTFFEEDPDFCAEMIASAYRSLEYYLPEYYPDGASEESAGYWNYAMSYFNRGQSAVYSTLGTGYGYDNTIGLRDTATYIIYLTGVQKMTFHDDDNGGSNPIESMYWAKHTNNVGLGVQRVGELRDGKKMPLMYDLIWLDYEKFMGGSEMSLQLDKTFQRVMTGSMRTSWRDPNSVNVFYHAGTDDVGHAHLDMGQWEYEALGQHWFWDLGRDWLVYSPQGDEPFTVYDVYRYRTEAHNCVVINPDAEAGQDQKTWNPVIKEVSKPKGAYAIADLSAAYHEDATSYKRGWMLTDDRRKTVIQDEITMPKPSELYWFANTKADVEIAEDGKSAVLTQKGKRLWVGLDCSDPNAVFTLMPASPLPTSKQLKLQEKNEDFRKLAIHLENVEEISIAVTLEPLEYEWKEPSLLKPGKLDEWSIPDGERMGAAIKNIKLDGVEYSGYDQYLYDYTIPLDFGYERIPEVTMDVHEGYTIVLTQEGMNATAVIRSETDPDFYQEIHCMFNVSAFDGVYPDMTKLNVLEATASLSPQEPYPPSNVLDGDTGDESRWSSYEENGVCWLMLDLGSSQQIDYTALAFYAGNTRTSNFEVYTSEDGQNWTEVGAFVSGGQTAEMESYRLQPSMGRYVKYTFHGTNDGGTWNSVKEAAVYRKGGN